MNLIRYIAGRLVVYALVIVFALTVLFFVPRLGPTDPVEAEKLVTTQGPA